MTEQEVFVLADRALNDVVSQIKDDQWDMPLPQKFAMRHRDKVPTLKELINYHAYDDAWVPDVLAGKTIAEVGDKYDGDLLGDDPKGNFAKLVDTAVAAVESFNDLDRTVHLNYGDWPAREYLWHITYFRGLRVHDISKAIGLDYELPDDLVKGLWDQIRPNAEEWRKIGVLPPEVAVPEDAPLRDRLLGMCGRDPKA